MVMLFKNYKCMIGIVAEMLQEQALLSKGYLSYQLGLWESVVIVLPWYVESGLPCSNGTHRWKFLVVIVVELSVHLSNTFLRICQCQG